MYWESDWVSVTMFQMLTFVYTSPTMLLHNLLIIHTKQSRHTQTSSNMKKLPYSNGVDGNNERRENKTFGESDDKGWAHHSGNCQAIEYRS